MYDKITLPSLITLLSEKTGKSKKLCEDFLREFFSTLTNTLTDGENVKIKGIGTFKVVEVEPRKSVNVNTGEEMEIPSHRKITFTPAKEMAEDVNSPFAMFESVEIGDEVEEESEAVEESVADEEKPSITEQPAIKEPVTVKEVIIQSLQTEEPKTEETEEPVDAEEEVEESEEEEAPVEEEVEEPSGEPTEETSEETIDESFPEYAYYEDEPKKKYNFLWGFLCGLFCTAIVVAICYFFLADKFNAMMGSFQDKDQSTTMVVATQPVPADTVNDSNDSVSNESDSQKIAEDKDKDNDSEVKDAAAPTQPSDKEVFDTISQTRYLTTMAKAHYGNYNLWPIIYEENKNILGHPDRIRPGTRVVIPSLAKYGVDPDNPDDIAKAKKKGVEIYARFK
ncbi:MAG: HU family DNA-binding protein [Muribaculaceae bacterium]|nr:HU family DNA-binding protein [Muribaculaceae bacterium]